MGHPHPRPGRDGDGRSPTFEGKLVVVGWHRTGITTLHVALQHLGYRTAGSDRLANRLMMAGYQRPLWRYARGFDAFRDFPWSLLFAEFDRRYPDSRFILTRRDDDAWIESYKRHHDSAPNAALHRWLYGLPSPHGNEARFIDRKRQHEQQVRDHFAGTGRLLEIDVIGGEQWEALCPFLGHPIPDEAFPNEASRILDVPPPSLTIVDRVALGTRRYRSKSDPARSE